MSQPNSGWIGCVALIATSSARSPNECVSAASNSTMLEFDRSFLNLAGMLIFMYLVACDYSPRPSRSPSPTPDVAREADLRDDELAPAAIRGSPACTIAERFPFCARAIRDVIESPGDARALAILYCMLASYSALASDRRDADRQLKSVRPQEFKEGLHTLDSRMKQEALDRVEPNQEAIDRLVERKGIVCPWAPLVAVGKHRWWVSMGPMASRSLK